MKNITIYIIISLFFTIHTSILTITSDQDLKSNTLPKNILIGYLIKNQSNNSKLITQSINYLHQLYQARTDIKFYYVYCEQSSNNKLAVCKNYNKQIDLIKLYIKEQLINYSVKSHSIEKILNWVNARLNAQPSPIYSKDELVLKTIENGFIFCYFPLKITQNNKDFNKYITLSKRFPYLNFYYIQDKQLRIQLGMKQENLTVYKNQNLQRSDLQIKNSDVWEAFVLTFAFPKLNLLDLDQLNKKRFKNQQQINFIALFCDQSIQCDLSIPVFRNLVQKNSIQSNIQYRLYFTDKLRQIALFKFYYHLSKITYPSLVHVKLNNGYLNISKKTFQNQIIQIQIINFSDQVKNGKLQLQIMSEKQFPNNGYTGKAGQKYIQKLNYNSFKENAIDSDKNYLVLFTVLGNGCADCQAYWKQFKKLRAYLQEQSSIVFAIYDFSKNLLNIRQIQRIPELLLYRSGYKSDPIRFYNRFDFVQTLKFLRQNVKLPSLQL